MPYLTQLANLARRTGYPVTVVSGWKQRGHGPQPEVRGIVAHHTAGASGGGDYPSLAVVRDGRPDLSGPLSHLGIGRSGRIYVIAAGRCWHNAPSTSSHHANSNAIGIEAENDGSQPWPPAQIDAYTKLCAQLCHEFDLPASRVRGHKEVHPYKPDPHTLDMGDFRSRVARVIAGDDLEDPDMPDHVRFQGRDLDLIVPPGHWRFLPFTLRNSEALDETYYSTVFGPAIYMAGCSVRFAGTEGLGYAPLERGTEVQLRAIEVIKKGDAWEPAEKAPIDSPRHSSGGGHFTYTWPGNNQASHRLRFQVTQHGDHPVMIDQTDASIIYWPR